VASPSAVFTLLIITLVLLTYSFNLWSPFTHSFYSVTNYKGSCTTNHNTNDKVSTNKTCVNNTLINTIKTFTHPTALIQTKCISLHKYYIGQFVCVRACVKVYSGDKRHPTWKQYISVPHH